MKSESLTYRGVMVRAISETTLVLCCALYAVSVLCALATIMFHDGGRGYMYWFLGFPLSL
jgi:hypothetical protein